MSRIVTRTQMADVRVAPGRGSPFLITDTAASDALREADRPFIAAVLAAPDDDVPRVLYADHLRDTGRDARAELIDAGVRLHNTLCHQPDRDPVVDPPRTPYNRFCNDTLCEHCELDRRVADLLQRRRMALIDGRVSAVEFSWLPWPLRSWLLTVGEGRAQFDNPESPTWGWRRGFVEEVACTADGWLHHGRDLVRATPITRVTITDWEVVEQPVYSETPRRWMPPVRQRVGTLHRLVGRLPAVFAPEAVDYATEAMCRAAVSDHAIAWAKRTDPLVGGEPTLQEWRCRYAAVSEAAARYRAAGLEPPDRCLIELGVIEP